jgi:hypothetical protein
MKYLIPVVTAAIVVAFGMAGCVGTKTETPAYIGTWVKGGTNTVSDAPPTPNANGRDSQGTA